ncbi:MAG: cellulose biosynthesis cyclic di-GMP-binding regulatory protein BcsB [Fimbriimonas sp.]|nr:cellulose biosynthesis cyclic di-GMP-binding regulatory protein BcsB [Fimbriimonas sp.]
MKTILVLLTLTSVTGICTANDFTLHPFRSDVAIHADGALRRTYFELPRHLGVSRDGSYQVDFEAAPEALKPSVALTVVFNGQPVGSRALSAHDIGLVHWNVPLPMRFFKEGYNEVSITSRSQPTLGPCREDNDLRNWVRILSSTSVTIGLNTKPIYPLVAFPYPYLNWLSQTATSVPILVPKATDDATLSSALNLAAALGAKFPDKPVEVRMARSAVDPLAIHVGLARDLGLTSSSEQIEAREDGLWLSGANPEQLGDSIATICNPDLVAQMSGFSANSVTVRQTPPAPSTRIGKATFRDLAVSPPILSGLGDQSTSFVLHRPVGAALGRECELDLRFRHSANLWSTKSLLTITVNGKPIGSVALTPENANNGVLQCEIPIGIIDANEWQVQITSHNEVVNPNCSAIYENVAWLTILDSSSFTLKEGSLPNPPYLEGFPYFRGRNGRLSNRLIVALGSNPSDGALTLAATTAARASQTNRGNTTWLVSTGPLTGHEDLVIGLLSEDARFRALSAALLVTPTATGRPSIAKGVSLLPTTLRNGVVIQAVQKPDGGVTYVVLGATDSALASLAKFMSSPDGLQGIHGRLAVYSAEGELFSFDTGSASDRSAAEEEELSRYTPSMKVIMGVIATLFALLLVYIVSRFVKSKSDRN